MSANNEGEQPVTSRGYNAGGLVAYPRPDEIVVPLRREEFDTLCEGGVSDEKSSRDLYIGGCFASLAGLIGVLVTTDWASTWTPERRWFFLGPFLALCMMSAGLVVGACIYHGRLKRARSNSPFSRLKTRLLGLFNEARTPDIPIDKLQGTVVKQTSASSGVKWENVANIFWLGNDLRTTQQTAWNNASKDKILRALTQSYHHLSELGLTNSGPAKVLSSLKTQVDSMPEAALNPEWRTEFAGKLSRVVQDVSDMAKVQQPGFKSHP